MAEYEGTIGAVGGQHQTAICLCAGYGGLETGVRFLFPFVEPICCVEWEAFAAEKLAESMEEEGMAAVPIWTDARTFDGTKFCVLADWIIGGFPCQPFSAAGKQLGKDDPRHLWPHVARIVGEVKPSFVFFENVSGIVGIALEEILLDLDDLGYEVATGLFTAVEVTAPHKRERVFIFGVRRELVNDQRADAGSRIAGEEEEEEGKRRGGFTDAVCFVSNSTGTRCSGRKDAGADTGDEGQDGCGCGESVREGAELTNNNNKRLQRRQFGSDQYASELFAGEECNQLADPGCSGTSSVVGHSTQHSAMSSINASDKNHFLPIFPPGPNDFDAWLECLYSTPTKRRLSPRFAFRLMGWKLTGLPGSSWQATELSLYRRRMHSQLCTLLYFTATGTLPVLPQQLKEVNMAREYDNVYLTPIYASTPEAMKQLDATYQAWGFSEYAELLIEDLDKANLLDKIADEALIVKWCVSAPYPCYRVTRQRYLDLCRRGVRRITEEQAGKVREHWISGKALSQ